jgi:hypothetical protein
VPAPRASGLLRLIVRFEFDPLPEIFLRFVQLTVSAVSMYFMDAIDQA